MRWRRASSSASFVFSVVERSSASSRFCRGDEFAGADQPVDVLQGRLERTAGLRLRLGVRDTLRERGSVRGALRGESGLHPDVGGRVLLLVVEPPRPPEVQFVDRRPHRLVAEAARPAGQFAHLRDLRLGHRELELAQQDAHRADPARERLVDLRAGPGLLGQRRIVFRVEGEHPSRGEVRVDPQPVPGVVGRAVGDLLHRRTLEGETFLHQHVPNGRGLPLEPAHVLVLAVEPGRLLDRRDHEVILVAGARLLRQQPVRLLHVRLEARDEVRVDEVEVLLRLRVGRVVVQRGVEVAAHLLHRLVLGVLHQADRVLRDTRLGEGVRLGRVVEVVQQEQVVAEGGAGGEEDSREERCRGEAERSAEAVAARSCCSGGGARNRIVHAPIDRFADSTVL